MGLLILRWQQKIASDVGAAASGPRGVFALHPGNLHGPTSHDAHGRFCRGVVGHCRAGREADGLTVLGQLCREIPALGDPVAWCRRSTSSRWTWHLRMGMGSWCRSLRCAPGHRGLGSSSSGCSVVAMEEECIGRACTVTATCEDHPTLVMYPSGELATVDARTVREVGDPFRAIGRYAGRALGFHSTLTWSFGRPVLREWCHYFMLRIGGIAWCVLIPSNCCAGSTAWPSPPLVSMASASAPS